MDATNYTPRTDDEIVAEIRKREAEIVLFDFSLEDLLEVLPFDRAKPWIKDSVTAEEWGDASPRTHESIVGRMRDYMDFAWEKANDERGLSAERSIQHFTGWLWLLGDDEMLVFAENEDNYPMYGRPILAKICEVYGFENKDQHK